MVVAASSTAASSSARWRLSSPTRAAKSSRPRATRERWGAGPNPLPGAIAARAPWAYLVEQGEVRGRVEGVCLTGNDFDLLTRVVAIGSDATWVGSWCAPSMVFEGVGVVQR
jgi:predicted Zn-dependent protease